MNTKNKKEEGPQKAAEAYALFEQMKPDGVIAVDDNAQTMFVIPYLKDKVKMPVVFCGVNAAPGKLETYGYPSSNVTGVMEYEVLEESISFMKQLVPNMKTLGFLSIDSEVGQALASALDVYLDCLLQVEDWLGQGSHDPQLLEPLYQLAGEANDLLDELSEPPLAFVISDIM